MYRLAVLLHEIAICFSREYMTAGTRLRVLFEFCLVRLKRPFLNNRAEGVRFLGYSLFAPSYVNLVTILREVFIFGDYYFKARNERPNIIDCGGNIGLSTLFFKWLYPNARVTVFEPSPLNVETLKKNISSNNLKDVEVVQAAVSDKEGAIKFWENQTKPGSSTAVQDVYDVKNKKGASTFVEYEVAAKKLSAFINEHVDLLKMDIEGAEGLVIAELAECGAFEKIDNIIMEYHHNLDNKSNDLPRLFSTLHDNGFKTLIFETELSRSSERLVKGGGGHFMLRASRIQA